MDQQTYETGLKIRSEVLGKEYVENSMKSADDFNKPFQEFVTEYCWGAGWGRSGLSRIAFAASWNPLKKSKEKTTRIAIRMISRDTIVSSGIERVPDLSLVLR